MKVYLLSQHLLLSIGGAIRDIKAGKIAEGSVIVCTVTGNGLKDPDTAIKQCADAVMLSIDATMDQVKIRFYLICKI